MDLTRRRLCLLLPALCSSSAWASGQGTLPSSALRFEDLPVRKNKENSFRRILEGTTHTGDRLEVHETTLAPGNAPHPPHRHLDEELFLIQEGLVEVTIAGKNSRLGPGSAAFVSSNEEHAIRNVGPVPAQYFVVKVGSKAR